MQWTPAVGDDFRVRVTFTGSRRERAESAVWGTCSAEVWLRHEALERLSRDDGAHDGALVKENLILSSSGKLGDNFQDI